VDRFNAANTSHDGRLTLPQAQVANMPWVARNFAAIDTQQKGYITMQDVLTYPPTDTRQSARCISIAERFPSSTSIP
jgi:hypothetical protein